MISRNVVFREKQLFKDIDQGKVKEIAVDQEKPGETVKSSTEVGETSKTVSEDQEEGGAAQTELEVEGETTVESEDLSNYQLARDRTRREIVKPARYTEDSAVAFALSVAEEIDCEEPANYEEALSSQEWEKWDAAMDDEYGSLEKNKMWNLVDLPKDKKAIGCKWLYKKKPGIPGVEPPRHKARLAKGYSQKEGVDYQEIFAHVVKHISIRLMLSMVVDKDLELEQLDVKTAFLHGDIEEEIYMEQPQGYKVKRKEGNVCKLIKSLYGLKQAPRQWNKCFDHCMIKNGFTKSEFDMCVYFKKLRDDNYIYLLLYVDDMLLVSKNMSDIKHVKEMLGREFDMKDLGSARRILGMDIERDRAGGVLKLSQSRYIKKVLQVFRMDQADVVATPLGAHFKLVAVKEGDPNVGT